MEEKEEKKEIITEVVQKEPKERMKANFKRFRKVMQAFEICLIVVIILVVIVGAAIGIYSLVTEQKNAETNESYTLVEETSSESKSITTADIVRTVATAVIALLEYIFLIMLLDNLKTIFANAEKTGTPFLRENIKSTDRITIISVILGIIGTISSLFDGNDMTMGLIFLFVVLCIAYIFRCGCELENKEDKKV